MRKISAIYEKGVFRPVEPVDLPEHSRARVEVDESPQDADPEAEMYRIMGLRFESGDPTGAELHDEHQP